MKKAEELAKILTNDHTEVMAPKYVKVVLQVATLEERIRTFMSFGLVERSKELNEALITLIEAIRDEFIEDQNNKKK